MEKSSKPLRNLAAPAVLEPATNGTMSRMVVGELLYVYDKSLVSPIQGNTWEIVTKVIPSLLAWPDGKGFPSC
jgi:hypothetical protein